MKKIKTMAQKIRKISILYPKTSKEFYHQIKFRKSVMSRRCSLKKLFLIILQYSQENTCVGGIPFLIKIIFNKRPTTLSKRDSNASVFLVILPNFFLKNICERLLLRVFPLMSQFERFSTWTNNKANYIGGEEDVLKSKTKRTILKLS